MMVKLLLPVLVLLSCLSMSGPANAYPWNSLEGYENIEGYEHLADKLNYYLSLTHLNPTYLTFAGQDANSGEPYNATIYMDISRDYSESKLGRGYYARYVSGNIFGTLSNLDGRAGDYLTIPTQEGSAIFNGGNGLFWNFSQPFSSLRTGDYLNFSSYSDTLIYMSVTNWYEVPSSTAPVPEPGTCLLLAAGLGGLGFLRRFKKA